MFFKDVFIVLLKHYFQEYLSKQLRLKLQVLYKVIWWRIKTHLMVIRFLWSDDEGNYMPMIKKFFMELVVYLFLVIIGSYGCYGDSSKSNGNNIIVITPTSFYEQIITVTPMIPLPTPLPFDTPPSTHDVFLPSTF